MATLGSSKGDKATLSLRFEGEPFSEQIERSTNKRLKAVLTAMKGAADDASREILARGSANISDAGHFGSRWISGLKVNVTGGPEEKTDVTISVSHALPFFMVFERGALIRGRPLLWIPLSSAPQAQGVYAKNYPGRLFRVNRHSGAPLLLDSATKQPIYVGKPFVTVPKKFSILEIIADVANELDGFYAQRLKQGPPSESA